MFLKLALAFIAWPIALVPVSIPLAIWQALTGFTVAPETANALAIPLAIWAANKAASI